MLTKEQAISFLKDSWGMKNVEAEIVEDREKFLNKLIVIIHERVPFHSLFLRELSFLPPEERKMPSLDEIDEICMSGMGGSCSFINAFTYRLLKTLGYSAFVCRSTVTSAVHNPHLIVIVKDLVSTGDLHLVDCGLGLPSFQAISLNFNEESTVYHDSFLEYKFIKCDDEIFRMHGAGDVVVHNDPPKEGLDFIRGKWRRFYMFTPETLQCESLSDLGPLIAGLFLSRLEPRVAVFPKKKAVLLNAGNILYIEDDNKTLNTITLESKEEIVDAFRAYFPMIDENFVRGVYSKWNISKL